MRTSPGPGLDYRRHAAGGELNNPALICTVLGVCARSHDGRPAAATIQWRKRAVSYNTLVGCAIEVGLLGANLVWL